MDSSPVEHHVHVRIYPAECSVLKAPTFAVHSRSSQSRNPRQAEAWLQLRTWLPSSWNRTAIGASAIAFAGTRRSAVRCCLVVRGFAPWVLRALGGVIEAVCPPVYGGLRRTGCVRAYVHRAVRVVQQQLLGPGAILHTVW